MANQPINVIADVGPPAFGAPPPQLVRPRNGGRFADGDDDALRLGPAGTVDPRPTGVPPPPTPGNPFRQ